MTSNDVVTVEVFNARMDSLMLSIELSNERTRNELREEIRQVASDVRVNAAKIEMLQHTFYWGFGIMAIVVALIPYFRRERKSKEESNKNSSFTLEQVQELIDNSIAKAMKVSGR